MYRQNCNNSQTDDNPSQHLCRARHLSVWQVWAPERHAACAGFCAAAVKRSMYFDVVGSHDTGLLRAALAMRLDRSTGSQC